MNWLLETFADTSDQARAITALFVAGVAIAAVLINQAFLTFRARKEKLIEKVEDFYSETSEAQTLITDVHVQVVSGIDFNRGNFEAEKPHAAALEKLRSCKKLSSLYFEETFELVASIEEAYIELHAARVSAESFSDYIDVYKELSPGIEKQFKTLYRELKAIMNKVMH